MSAAKRFESMSSFGYKHLCSVLSSDLKRMPKENLGHQGQMLVKFRILLPKKAHGLNIDKGETHTTSNNLQSAHKIAVLKHQLECQLDSTHTNHPILLHNCCASLKAKASYDDISVWTYHQFYISVLISGRDPRWNYFNHRGFLQEWPRLSVSVPRQGPDRWRLPELQSAVPVRQLWYVPHVWKPDTSASLSSGMALRR